MLQARDSRLQDAATAVVRIPALAKRCGIMFRRWQITPTTNKESFPNIADLYFTVEFNNKQTNTSQYVASSLVFVLFQCCLFQGQLRFRYGDSSHAEQVRPSDLYTHGSRVSSSGKAKSTSQVRKSEAAWNRKYTNLKPPSGMPTVRIRAR